MPTFIIPWSMTGEIEIEATTREEAQDQFDQMDIAEIAATNTDFNNDPPMTEVEMEEEFERWRNSGNSPLDNLLREEIAQKIEKGHG